jgi:hypothetical protein
MPSSKAWVCKNDARVGGKGLEVSFRTAILKLESILKERIYVIDLNCYMIKILQNSCHTF